MEALKPLVVWCNAILVIEHNLDVIRCGDWTMDLCTGGNKRRSETLARGTFETVAASHHPYGQVALQVLSRRICMEVGWFEA